MDEPPVKHPRRGVQIGLGLLRGAGIATGFFLIYALLPGPVFPYAPTVYLIVCGVLFGLALVWQLRRIGRAASPGLQAIETIAVLLPLTIVAFAWIYLSYSLEDPTSFSEPLGKIDAVYFAVTTLTTTGFGDIHAVAPHTRLAVTANMIIDLVLIGVVFRLVANTVSEATRRRRG